MKVQLNFRVEEEVKKRLEEIARQESKKAGYDVTPSNIAVKALNEFIKNYK